MMHKFRSFLYWLAKLLGDAQAITSKKRAAIPKRIGRRIVGRAAGKAAHRCSFLHYEMR